MDPAGVREVLGDEEVALFTRMAGHRNRMVHFYDEVSEAELYEICSGRLPDVERVLAGLHRWIREHPSGEVGR